MRRRRKGWTAPPSNLLGVAAATAATAAATATFSRAAAPPSQYVHAVVYMRNVSTRVPQRFYGDFSGVIARRIAPRRFPRLVVPSRRHESW
jgi:hypothetical protein